MANPGAAGSTVAVLLGRHGTTFAQQAGIAIARNTPSPLFRLLCLTLLLSAPIRAANALRAARALTDQGWTTPAKLRAASWDERVRVLNRSGYARYDERTSTALGATCELLLDRYRGDLRRLREAADFDRDRERQLLKECKGIGDTGVDLYFREVQGVWPEVAPFADRRALQAARRLGLGEDAEALAPLVDRQDLPRLVAALAQVEQAGTHEAVLAEAAHRSQRPG